MNIEPKLFLSPSYEFYNKCHDKSGQFCETDDSASGKATVDDYSGNAYRDNLTDLNTVYRVTGTDEAESVNQGKGFSKGGGNWGVGYYFSPNKSDSYGTYAATAHLQGRESHTFKARTNVQNPLILETDSTGHFWNKISSVLSENTASWTYQNARNESEKYDEPLDVESFSKRNLGAILHHNGNDALLVRNPGGGGHNIGGETLVVPDLSNIWLAN